MKVVGSMMLYVFWVVFGISLHFVLGWTYLGTNLYNTIYFYAEVQDNPINCLGLNAAAVRWFGMS